MFTNATKRITQIKDWDGPKEEVQVTRVEKRTHVCMHTQAISHRTWDLLRRAWILTPKRNHHPDEPGTRHPVGA